MYLVYSLAVLSLICRLETSGESSFFLHLLGLWMSALGCLLLIIFLIVPEPFVMFLMKSVVFLNIVGVVSTPHFIERD